MCIMYKYMHRQSAALQMGHNYLYAHVSPKKLQNFNNKLARDLVLDLVLILTKD